MLCKWLRLLPVTRLPGLSRGKKTPEDCAIFGDPCTPENPLGACMVSSEGACAAHWTYGRFRDRKAARA